MSNIKISQLPNLANLASGTQFPVANNSGSFSVTSDTIKNYVVGAGFTSSGNITASYLFGNGSQLTGIDATSIQNGTSAVSVISSGGNVRANIAGATVQVLSTGGANITGYVTASGNVTGSYILGNGSQLTGIDATSIQNGTSAVSVISSGGNIRANVAGATVQTLSTGGADVTGYITASGNVTGSYILGNGSQLTGIDATSIQNGTANVRTFNNGNVTVSAAGTANVVVVTSTGANITGTLNATGNANVGNLGATNIVGTLTTASQTNITSVGTLGSLNVTGNANVGNLGATNIVGTLTTASQTNITSVGTLGSLNVTGNANAGNLGATSVVATNLSGTIQTAAQPNITSLGTLGSLAVSGNITPGGISMSSGNAIIGNLYVSGNTTIAGNITQISGNSGQFFGNASTGFNALYAGLPAGYSLVPQSVVNFITSFDGYSQVNLQNISAGNTSTSDYIVTSDEGDDTTHYVDLGIAGSTYNGDVAVLDNALGNILKPGDGYLYVTGHLAQARIGNLAIGTPDGNSVTTIFNGGSSTGNVSAQFFAPNLAATSATTGTFRVKGGIASSSTVWATGNITGGNLSGTSIVGTLTTAAQTNITSVGTLGSLAVTGNITSGNLQGTSIVGTLTTAAQTNITSVGALNAGTITSGFGTIDIGTDTITVGGIINANANGTGNIGSASVYFNTVFAKATSAQYADLAEKYVADAEYAPGTVLAFGGTNEVTLSTEVGSTRVAGVVSTNPSYIMNAGLTGEHVAMVALQGRVPCRVVGPVRKGDMMVAATNGAAQVDNSARAGTIIGKALENFDGAQGTIEIVVGRN